MTPVYYRHSSRRYQNNFRRLLSLGNLYPVAVVFENVLYFCHPWWRHQMETFSALLAICAGDSPVTLRPVTRSFDVFFDLRWINGWVNNRKAGDLRRHRAHYDVIVMARYHDINRCQPVNLLPLENQKRLGGQCCKLISEPHFNIDCPFDRPCMQMYVTVTS